MAKVRGVRHKAHKELKGEKDDDDEEEEEERGRSWQESREDRGDKRESKCLLAEKDRCADDSSSSPFLALPTKSRRDYAAILDVGKYPVPKESLQSGEGSGIGRRSKSLLLLADLRGGGGSWIGGGWVDSSSSSSSNDVGVARMKKALRKKVESVTGAERSGAEGRGGEGGTRKGKEVRRGLGGTRRISPLQRILSALHLFQDVVFPLRRESHTPFSAREPRLVLFRPVPCRVCHFHHRYRDILRLPLTPFRIE